MHYLQYTIINNNVSMDISEYYSEYRDKYEPTLVFSIPIDDVFCGLYLTCRDTAKNILKYNIPYQAPFAEIGVAINCCRKRYKTPSHITFYHFPIKDIPDANIISVAKQCIQIINRSFAEKKSVLINCYAGVSRSASVVIAYLMTKGYMFKDAYSTITGFRKCINPNREFSRANHKP